jgi:hypothetical protein
LPRIKGAPPPHHMGLHAPSEQMTAFGLRKADFQALGDFDRGGLAHGRNGFFDSGRD